MVNSILSPMRSLEDMKQGSAVIGLAVLYASIGLCGALIEGGKQGIRETSKKPEESRNDGKLD